MPSLLLIIALVCALVYLLLDAVQKYAAVQEIVRLAFAAAFLGWCLGAVK